MKFFVFGQNLRAAQRIIASGTARVLTADFRFSPEWALMRKYAHFEQGDKKYPVLIENDKITADKSLNLGQGVWEVWVHGNRFDDDANFQRITTVKTTISVDPSGLCGDPLPIEPPSFGEQLDERVSALEAGGGGGGGGGTTDHSKLINRGQPDQHPMEAITGLTELRDKINAFLDADDSTLDQLTELIAAIKENAGTIEQLTNGKVNTSDIVNDLTTGGAGKVLSAEMGKELKRLIDAIEPPDLASQVEAAQTAAGRAESAESGANSAAETARGHADNAAQSATTATEKAEAAGASAQTATSEADRAKQEADRAEQAGSKPGGSGLSTEEKGLIITIMRAGTYTNNQKSNIDRLEELFGGGEPVKAWTITNNLTNCKSNNPASTITPGSQYAATLTADQGFTLDGATVTIVMGGSEVTSDVYSKGKILIPAATGDIVITATAKEIVVPVERWRVTNNLANCVTSNPASSTDKGMPYNAIISASEGYTLDGATVTITMGGSDITTTAYKDGTISIPSATGDIIIAVSAVVATPTPVLPENGLRGYFDCTGGHGETLTEAAPQKGENMAMRLKDHRGTGTTFEALERGYDVLNGPYDGLKIFGETYGPEWTLVLNEYSAETTGLIKPQEYFGRVTAPSLDDIARVLASVKYVDTSNEEHWIDKGSHDYPATPNDYHTLIVSATESSVTTYIDSNVMAVGNAGDYADFKHWFTDVKIRSEKGGATGLISHLAVYNRSLTADEVRQITDYFETLEV